MGWVANFFLILGSWLLGYKWRSAFLIIAGGEALWVYASWGRGWDMVFLCALFCILALRNWLKWAPSTITMGVDVANKKSFVVVGHYHNPNSGRPWWKVLLGLGKVKWKVPLGSYVSSAFYGYKDSVLKGALKDTHPWVVEPDEEYKARQAMTQIRGAASVYEDLKATGKIVRMTWERHKFETGYKRQGWTVIWSSEGVGEGEGGFDIIWEKPN